MNEPSAAQDPPPQASGTGDSVCEVVITGPDEAVLASLTHELVTRRLAACGHVIPQIRAIYWWEGAVHDEPEARVALHTRRSLVRRVRDVVATHHPYAVPCVLVLPVVEGSPSYLQWVLDETAHAAPDGSG